MRRSRKLEASEVVTTSDGLKVYCAFTKMVPVADLKPHPKNWNEHPPEQLEMAAKIFEQGIRRPIRVSALSGLITVGHGALETAKMKGWKEWPVEIQAYASEKDELADVTADNKLGAKSRANPDKLAALLQELHGEMDIEIAGVTDAEMAAIMARLDNDKEKDLVPVKVIPPPETAWVLIGIPVARWKEIAPHVEAVAKIPGLEYHSSTGTAPIVTDED